MQKSKLFHHGRECATCVIFNQGLRQCLMRYYDIMLCIVHRRNVKYIDFALTTMSGWYCSNSPQTTKHATLTRQMFQGTRRSKSFALEILYAITIKSCIYAVCFSVGVSVCLLNFALKYALYHLSFIILINVISFFLVFYFCAGTF